MNIIVLYFLPETDTRLRMYRRGDKRAENHGTDRRVRTGAFLSVEKELKENEPVEKSLSKKADEMIGQFYKESTHTPTIGGDKLYLKENITHNVKLKVIKYIFLSKTIFQEFGKKTSMHFEKDTKL